MDYLSIKEIAYGELQEKKANAIIWEVNQLRRNANTANLDCRLFFIDNLTNAETFISGFSMEIPNDVLQSWGSDDSVIDNFVLTYSPLFERPN